MADPDNEYCAKVWDIASYLVPKVVDGRISPEALIGHRGWVELVPLLSDDVVADAHRVSFYIAANLREEGYEVEEAGVSLTLQDVLESVKSLGPFKSVARLISLKLRDVNQEAVEKLFDVVNFRDYGFSYGDRQMYGFYQYHICHFDFR